MSKYVKHSTEYRCEGGGGGGGGGVCSTSDNSIYHGIGGSSRAPLQAQWQGSGSTCNIVTGCIGLLVAGED